jgi:hypothetical protein
MLVRGRMEVYGGSFTPQTMALDFGGHTEPWERLLCLVPTAASRRPAYAGLGMAPSCWRRPNAFITTHCSAILPLARRKTSIDSNLTLTPRRRHA